jgi:hypothetical protein
MSNMRCDIRGKFLLKSENLRLKGKIEPLFQAIYPAMTAGILRKAAVEKSAGAWARLRASLLEDRARPGLYNRENSWCFPLLFPRI